MTKLLKIAARICAICGLSFNPTGPRQKYCPICRLLAIRGYKKKYKKTDKGRASEWRYLHSEKGKARKYKSNHTENTIQIKRRYSQSDAGRVAIRKYRTSAKGKACAQRQRARAEYQLAQKVRRVFKNVISWKNLDMVHPLLGYTPRRAIEHIKSLFIPGMVFEDRKTWCIHHIKPINLFTGDENTIIKEANALENITVLTHKEHSKLHGTLLLHENTMDHNQILNAILEERHETNKRKP